MSVSVSRGEAVRYGNEKGEYDEASVTRIANFVLGHDVETRSTVLNERMMDVVEPIKEFWNPNDGVADLLVTDPRTGTKMALGLGDWIARYQDGTIRPISHNRMVAKHLPQPKPLTFEQELVQLLKKHRVGETGVTAEIKSRFLMNALYAFDTALDTQKKLHGGI